MPHFERRLYEPEDLQVYDGSDDDMEDEGSRLPLLIFIALVVLAAFAGVVWLAYTQGVQRGRTEAPRVAVAQQNKLAAAEPKNPYSDLQIYRSPKGNDQTANNASTDTRAAPKATAPEHPVSKSTAAPSASAPVAKPISQTVGEHEPVQPPATTPAAATSLPASPAATSAPRMITPAPAPQTAPPQPNAKPEDTTDTAAINSVLDSQQAAAGQGAAGYVLQIGSYTSEEEANASWQTYKAEHSSVAGYAPDIAQADLGSRGTWYRLRVGPFATLGEAAAACAKLKAQGGRCFPAKR